MITNLYLIRHGEAYSNVEPIMGGMRGDRGLTERGIAQVEALARRLAQGEIAADVLYASTLPRARMTAERVAEALNLPIHWDDDLQELRPGEADGLHIDEARARFPQMSLFFKEYFTPIAPGGESWASFQFRASAALERLVTRHHGKTIVAVCHGGIVEVSFHAWAWSSGARTQCLSHTQYRNHALAPGHKPRWTDGVAVNRT